LRFWLSLAGSTPTAAAGACRADLAFGEWGITLAAIGPIRLLGTRSGASPSLGIEVATYFMGWNREVPDTRSDAAAHARTEEGTA